MAVKLLYKDDTYRVYVVKRGTCRRINPGSPGQHVILVRWGEPETKDTTRQYLRECGLDPDRCRVCTNDWFGRPAMYKDEVVQHLMVRAD